MNGHMKSFPSVLFFTCFLVEWAKPLHCCLRCDQWAVFPGMWQVAGAMSGAETRSLLPRLADLNCADYYSYGAWNKHWLNSQVVVPFKIQWDPCTKAAMPGAGTPIYFLYRDVPPNRVSFSGSTLLSRVYNFTFLCLKQSRPRNSSTPFVPPQPQIFADFMCLH